MNPKAPTQGPRITTPMKKFNLDPDDRELAIQVYSELSQEVAEITNQILELYDRLVKVKKEATAAAVARKFGIPERRMSEILARSGARVKPTPAIIYARERKAG